MRRLATSAFCLALTAPTGQAQEATLPTPAPASAGLYGLPGLIDMPTGEAFPDGELVTTIGNFAGMTRGTLAFQFAPRILGSFRYSAIEDWNTGGFDTYYDRSFDLRLLLLTENEWRPSLTLGFQDFIGTGIYSGEFLAASKRLFDDRLTVTAGLGWGRLGSSGAIGSTGTRPDREIGTGGEFEPDQWFRGDYAPFGGIEWRPIDRLSIKAEYSSDNYDVEDGERGLFDRKSPYNFGVEYQLSEDVRIGAYSLYGSEFGLMASVSINPGNPPQGGIRDGAPPPVLTRPSRSARPDLYTTDWAESQELRSQVTEMTSEAMFEQKLELQALRLTPTTATVFVRNAGYNAEAQALGRTARIMARNMPSSIETFTIVQTARGVRLPSVTFARKDVETFEVQPDGAEQMQARRVTDVAVQAPGWSEFAPGIYPGFSWQVGPYLRTSLFDPDQPFRADLGIDVGASWTPAPGFVFSGSVAKKLVGNLDDVTRESNSELPHVRSDYALYDEHGDPWIQNLYGAYYFQPGHDFYGRVTAGYLERMFAGVSTELLWAPFASNVALGAEINYARQRDFEGGFGLQDYDVVTGHASIYWEVVPQYHAQLDVGRYLAGDEGATLSLERVFDNGWRVGAFATKTNVSSEDFGEGSFDKGITMSIPLEWFIGRSTRSTSSFTVRPLTRDGGARLSVPGRLHGIVEQGTEGRLDDQWGRFWR